MKTLAAKNRIFYVYALSALTFLTLAVCGYYAMDKTGHMGHPAKSTQSFVTDMAYIDLPRINLQVGGGNSETHVRVEISLEVAKKDVGVLEGYQPKITDRINAYLEHLPPEEVRLTAGIPLLRAELLRQVNGMGTPVPVHDLMLRQMVIM